MTKSLKEISKSFYSQLKGTFSNRHKEVKDSKTRIYAKLHDNDFRGEDLRGINFYNVDLRGSDFRGANLHNAILRKADLRGTDMRGANLRSADFRDADMRSADLCNANLFWAKLHRADLRNTKIRKANLRWTWLRGIDLRGAKISCTCHDEFSGIYLKTKKEIINITTMLDKKAKKDENSLYPYFNLSNE